MSISSISRIVLRGLSVAALLIIVTACAPPAGTRSGAPATAVAPDPAAAANAALEAGRYLAAAESFGRLLDTSADEARRLRYAAMSALAYQDAGEFGQADHVLAAYEDRAAGDPALATARACSLLDAGLADHAWDIISSVDASRLDGYARGAHARCLGAAAWQTQHLEPAATAWVSAHRYPYPPERAAAIAAATWRAVAALPESALESAAEAADPGTAGWYALGLVAKRSMLDPAELAVQTAAWQSRFPGHPGAAVLESLHERSAALTTLPHQLALLLPFEGALGAAANAVRDGFINAWYQDAGRQTRPTLRLYTTSERAVSEVARVALGEGAEFIVGPLRKELVEELQSDATIDSSVLALNVADHATATRSNFYQFGLAPDAEAVQVARRAAQSGERALILAPDTAWGRRLGEAYVAAWSDLERTVLGTVYYNERAESYADAIERALNIDRSTARTAALRRRLGIPLHTAPRRRADIELILLAAFPNNARQIMPQLRYFGAADIPVFATSHVFSGTLDAEGDRDLDGITFGDMPWLFGVSDPATLALVQREWSAQTRDFARLFALGIDAYRIIPYLARMRRDVNLRLPGVTGDLSMTGAGVLERKLLWLRFVDGLPRRLDTLAAASDDAR